MISIVVKMLTVKNMVVDHAVAVRAGENS